ncbi:diacylglycerol kinase family protein [Microbacterium sp. C7(2022)]|uniref:diacylglycerol kinase family protein n=1 Tax=Microbacterium sp. C7(2022) TaxID=2992759 RepID=UPI00237A8907|nr:diacylglycerol kinase family protein [Microbacterium sp. C7(2022)]MDE0547276.1 diacylglycerol kinase family protein [Microbacterium sp. C7(2022)]
MNLALLVNPAARAGAHTNIAEEAARHLRGQGVQVSMLSGGSAEESRQLLRAAIAAGADAVAVMGGDGTVGLAINELAGTAIPLGIIPAGTGNDFALAMGIPERDAHAAADTIAADHVRTVDVARIGSADGSTQRYGTILATGFDSKVNDRANTMRWPRGRARYTLAILIEFLVLRANTYQVDWEHGDGTTGSYRGGLLLAAVANGPTYGGGIPIAPAAEMDDGLLDLVLVRPAGRLALLRLLGKVYRGAHESESIVSTYRVRSVTVDSPGLAGYADGDRVGELPITVNVEPKMLSVFARPARPRTSSV